MSYGWKAINREHHNDVVLFRLSVWVRQITKSQIRDVPFQRIEEQISGRFINWVRSDIYLFFKIVTKKRYLDLKKNDFTKKLILSNKVNQWSNFRMDYILICIRCGIPLCSIGTFNKADVLIIMSEIDCYYYNSLVFFELINFCLKYVYDVRNH